LRQRSSASARSSTPVFDGKRLAAFPGGEHGGSGGTSIDLGNTSAQSAGDSSPSSRLHSRRLDVGRPAPLQLNSTSRNDLPRLVREGAPDSARINHAIRPLPQPVQGGLSMTSGSNPNLNNSSSNIRSNLPPLPPAPRNQVPNPPQGRPPGRTTQMTGRRTPTGDPPPYALLPLLPNQALHAPGNGGPNNSWTGYGLPSDPRPGRVASPLPPMRGPPRTPTSISTHGRNVSLSSPNSSSPTKLPPRPSTGNTIHPYAQSSALGLQPPTQAQQAYNLSPIAESFISQHASATGTHTPPTGAYTVGRGPFNRPITPSVPSLDDLRRKLVKFLLPDEGHSCTINVADCAGGIEVLEKVLKKFGKVSSRDGTMEHVQTDEGGLSVDGWGVYLDWGQGDGPGQSVLLFLVTI
jgi:mitogen-activated protein kinase kinase kinase